MKIVKKILLVLLLALIVIQFIHPKKNKSEGPQPNFIGNSFAIPDDVKAILAKDFEAMENLGIYEVVEEDLALCEFVCTSKIDVQEILKEGLELVESEG